MQTLGYSAAECGLDHDLAWKIFLDRYTRKDLERRFVEGDVAIVLTGDDPKWPRKEIARVAAVAGDRMTVVLLTGEDVGGSLEVDRVRCDRPLERTVREVTERVGRAIASVEEGDAARHAALFAEEMAALRLVPGGRVWAGAGSGVALTLFNCYVVPNPRDSRHGIIDTLGQMIEIMARGGGVGINVSSLRPHRAPVRGVNGRSSGAVSWMDLYSRATGLVEQGGCFGPDVRIATDRGLLPAAELADRLEAGEPIRALTHAGSRALTRAFRNGVKPLLRVTTERGFRVEVTPEHRMGVVRDGRLATVPLRDLRPGDEVRLLLAGRGDAAGAPQPLTSPPGSGLPAHLDRDLARLLGYLHAACSARGGWEAGPSGAPAVRSSAAGVPARTLALAGSLLPMGSGAADWLQANGLLGGRGAEVRVPEAVFRSPAAVRRAFLAGCRDAAGGAGGLWGGEALLRDLQEMLAADGRVARLVPAAGGLHRLRAGRTLRRAAAAPTRPAGRAAGAVTAVAVRTARGPRHVADRIASVEFLGIADVLDFEVEDVHMLSGGGLYTSNSRRGALMLQLEVWHPDIWRFIDVKKTAGMVENANISLRVSDAFMAAVRAGADWDLVFPDTADPAYDTEWNGDLEAWRAAGRPIVRYETVPARRLWAAITDSAWQCAEPGVVFSDRHARDSNSWYFNPLVCTNPCVVGDTLVHTAGGLRRASELWASQHAPAVLTDGRFGARAFTPASAVMRTGFRPVVSVRTREGYEIRVTADHRLYSEKRGWVGAADLRPGEAVRIADRGGGFGTAGSREEGHVLGWLVGDAHFTRERAVLSFYGEERRELAGAFAAAVNRVIRPGRTRPYAPVGLVDVPDRELVTIASARLREFAAARGVGGTARPRVPEAVWTGSRDLQVGFLQALFEADGYVETVPGPRGGIRLSVASRELAADVQRLLLNFGVFSRLQRDRRAPDDARRRTVRLHVRAPRHQVVIVGAGVGRFAEEIGFLGEGKRGDLGAYLRSFVRGPYRQRFVAHVEGVAADGAEWVYDLTEPLTHSFVANGFVVHNCAEQPLPAWGVCTLGHVNLARMVAAGGREVDWERLGRTVRAGVRFLDDVVSATPYFFDENRRNQERERRVGLGTLGLAELMIRLGHRYGAPEAEPFLHRLFSFIRDEAYLASADLAAEKGPFPAFDAERYLRSGFCERLPEGVRERIRRDGIRNVTLLTQAPTGTVGTMVNTSTGIEPFFSFQFFRQSRLGFDEQWVPLAAEWLEAHPGESLPAHFVSAMQLSPEEHIRVQAVVQQYTDSSISKTANAPADYTREQTQRLYMLAYEAGCKGVTIYRDGSRQEQVLHDASAAAPEAPAGEPAAAPRAAASPPAAPSPRPRPDVIRGQTVRMAAPEGTVFVTLNEHPDGTPFEVFARAGKAGSDLTASVDAIARLASLALRSGIPVAAVVDQLEGIGGRNSVGFGPRRVRSVADAIARAMQMVWVGDGAAPEPAAAAEAPRRGDLCPACGEYALVYQEGCVTCSSCGHSEC